MLLTCIHGSHPRICLLAPHPSPQLLDLALIQHLALAPVHSVPVLGTHGYLLCVPPGFPTPAFCPLLPQPLSTWAPNASLSPVGTVTSVQFEETTEPQQTMFKSTHTLCSEPIQLPSAPAYTCHKPSAQHISGVYFPFTPSELIRCIECVWL